MPPMSKRFLAAVRSACDAGTLYALVPNTKRNAPTDVLFEETTPRNLDHHSTYGTFVFLESWLDLQSFQYHFFPIENQLDINEHFGTLSRTDAIHQRYWHMSVEMDGIPHSFSGSVGYQKHVDADGKETRKALTAYVKKAIFFTEGDAVMGRALMDIANQR